MKKIVLLISILIILIVGNYYYFDSKTTEVLLVGQVVGFEIENLDTEINETDSKTKPTSSKSVGTVTFYDEDTKEFAALGHSISASKEEMELRGKCYEIYYGYVRRNEDEEGRIIAEINEEERIGHLERANRYGIFGEYEDIENIEYHRITTANRYDVKLGEASIILNLDGNGLKEYEVEVTDINYIAYNQNIRITVKSEELIKLTGGIAQGMSGAPLVQNGKLIGAINCVNSMNPLDAYAIFIDKLI